MLKKCVERVADNRTLKAGARAAAKHVDIVVIDTPPGVPDTTYQAALVADLMLLPCGPSPLDLFALKEALSLSLQARAERRSKKPRIRFVPSKVQMSSNLSRELTSSLKGMGKKVLPAVGQRVVVAEAVASGLSVSEFAPNSPAHEEFRALAKAVEKILK
ncbi:MAG: ParA family protein [Ignavibacteriota bacterium]